MFKRSSKKNNEIDKAVPYRYSPRQLDPIPADEVQAIVSSVPMIKPFFDSKVGHTGNLEEGESLFAVNYEFMINRYNNTPVNVLTNEELVSRRLKLESVWTDRIRYFIGMCVSNLASGLYYAANAIDLDLGCSHSMDLYNDYANRIGNIINDIYYKMTGFSSRVNSCISDNYSYTGFDNLFVGGLVRNNMLAGNVISDMVDSTALTVYTEFLNGYFYKHYSKIRSATDLSYYFNCQFEIFRDSLLNCMIALEMERSMIIYPLSLPDCNLGHENKRMDWDFSTIRLDPVEE